MSSTFHKPAPNVPYWTPAQDPPAGSALDPASAPTLFKPIKIRGVELQNRLVVAPMCQYSADDGHASDWHFAHLSKFIIHGTPLTIIEATSVTPNGRISPDDLGLWKDSQIAGLKRIADFAHSQNQKLGIQLAHAGRKASTLAPWLVTDGSVGALASPEEGGWGDNVWAPSAIKYTNNFPDPKAMTIDDIKTLVQAFKDAARRSVEAGIDVIEIHAAHGYLITEFLSPLSNKRTDNYGGSFENRTRLLFEIIEAIRSVIPETMPLFVRISATEWMEWSDEPSWNLEQSIRLAKLLPAAGVDLLDVSSGGNSDRAKLNVHPYYQIDLAGKIREVIKKENLNLLIGAVGLVTTAETARSIVQEGKSLTQGATAHDSAEVGEEAGQIAQADIVLVARQYLREPEFTLRVAHELGVEVKWPIQYSRAQWQKGQKI
ncbi:FMN-linked oxidoreductase [Daldinia loculata]|uniref:FMN-linked oxidoreductase n=1 Tax=Daldinia loculata TaxID=103429 RepID=UPI0020C5306D|nr:FMN-linked oxidoreductase [Daldinia loculata]KAI1642936.1 FMN-linked oxidoreductase [Daldinia loculata]KAI2777313.1 FMN-linked oxidoreductase [Daldinia loculata]